MISIVWMGCYLFVFDLFPRKTIIEKFHFEAKEAIAASSKTPLQLVSEIQKIMLVIFFII